MKRFWIAVAAAGLVVAQPRLQNAKLENRAVTGSLDSTHRAIVASSAAPAWIAWAIPQIPGDRTMCCFNSNNGVSWQGCSLEPNNNSVTFGPSGGTVHLEGAAEFYVFLRIEDKKLAKIRSFSIDCNIDAGGLPVYFLTGVNTAQSVALLESAASSSDTRDDRRLADG